MNWIDEQIARERAHDLQRENERQALVSAAQRAGPARPRFYAPLLAGLGRHMAAIGAGLEQRYAPLPESLGEPCALP
jgi:hypothetical protein